MADAVVADRLARIETKIDGLSTSISSNEERTQKKLNDHDQRLRTVERFVWGFVAIGGVGLIGGGSAVATAIK